MESRWTDYTSRATIEPPGQDTRVRRRRLYEEVEARLEQDIREGRLKEGDLLPPERGLMERFGVGRPAIREALFALQKKGLVAVGSGERTRVTRPTPSVVVAELRGTAQHLLSEPEGVRHFQEVRTCFEAGMARAAALKATDEDVQRLREALAANRAAIGDRAEFERTDVAFHFALAVVTRNPVFTSIHEAVVGWLTGQRTRALMAQDYDKVAYDFHERICNAVAMRDAAAAEAIMRAHLENVASQFWRSYGSEG